MTLPVLRKALLPARRALASLGILAAAAVTTAHVGTTDAFFDGVAGPYPVRVTVRMPGVIPGQAQITVRVLEPTRQDAARVFVQAAQWNVGAKGAPAPEAAGAVPGAPGTFTAPLWLMTRSSYMVNVVVEGARGRGTVSVPVVAQSTTRLDMNRYLGWALAALGALLVAGLLTLVGSAVREAVLPPGEAPDRRRRVRARVATSLAAAVAALALLGGSRWWDAVDAGYRQAMYRPLASVATVRPTANGAALRLTITDSLFFNGRTTPLIPDHGKLMHLFAVREPSLDVLAHVHPTRADSASFDASIPALPPGRYRVYADIVHESGLARTLVATAEVPGGAALGGRSFPKGFGGDGDDAWLAGGAADSVAGIGDGLSLAWQNPGPVRAGADTALRFTVRDSAGRVIEVEPYMGMGAHAMVMRADGSVFVHLHPMGTISMAAQERLLRREQGDTALHGENQPSTAHDAHAAAVNYPGTLSFPFAFPKPGAYRVWVQVKRGGRVRTAAFDVNAV